VAARSSTGRRDLDESGQRDSAKPVPGLEWVLRGDRLPVEKVLQCSTNCLAIGYAEDGQAGAANESVVG